MRGYMFKLMAKLVKEKGCSGICYQLAEHEAVRGRVKVSAVRSSVVHPRSGVWSRCGSSQTRACKAASGCD